MPDHASVYVMKVTPVPLKLRVATEPTSIAPCTVPLLYIMVLVPEAGIRCHEPL